MNEDGTISGAFINALLTFVYLVILIAAIFVPFVADAVKKMESFMTWFFVASFGIWNIGKTITTLNTGGTNTNEAPSISPKNVDS
jgi:hypothetical protein